MIAFTPSSWLLLKMIERAEAKSDVAAEQAALRNEAQIEHHMVRAGEAETAQRARRFWLSRGGA